MTTGRATKAVGTPNRSPPAVRKRTRDLLPERIDEAKDDIKQLMKEAKGHR
jgi:hypothetical protein